MKLSIVHNVYKINPYIRESLQYNLLAVKNLDVDYEYIVFNDAGDKKVIDDIKDIVETNPKVKYHYSEVNYGFGQCRGGWYGSIPLISGDILHCIDDDDVFVEAFYKAALPYLQNKDIMFFSSNGLKADENLTPTSTFTNPSVKIDYTNPLSRWKEWFGVSDAGVDPWFQTPIPKNKVTRANNMLTASGTIYKTILHDLVGKPDPEGFRGTHDFEYWARILFNGYKGIYSSTPLWYYRISDHSISFSEQKNNTDHRPPYMEKIKQKYYNLWEQKKIN